MAAPWVFPYGEVESMVPKHPHSRHEVYREGESWKVRWHETSPAGGLGVEIVSEAIFLGQTEGPQRLTREQAERLASVAVITIAEFVRDFFVPDHVAQRKLSGRTHYQAILKHILGPEEVARIFRLDTESTRAKLKTVAGWPYMGHLRLMETRPEHVEALISAALQRNYSSQTALHIRNVVSAIFEHARKMHWFGGENPARTVALPEMTRRDTPPLTLQQVKEMLRIMRHPERELSLTILMTGMLVSEVCGLQWNRVNLTDCDVTLDGARLPPKHLRVSQRWYLGEMGQLNRRSGARTVAIPEPLLQILMNLRQNSCFNTPDDFVFSTATGKPVNAANVATLRLKPIGKQLGVPALSWHVLRRTQTSLMRELGMQSLVSM